MESKTRWEQSLIDMLAQVEEQAKQLEANLDEPSLCHLCKPLAQKIYSTIGTAITMATESSRMPRRLNNTGSDSPQSASDSPRSESSDRGFTDERKEMSKKRKAMPKWSRQVRVGSVPGTDSPMDDGYSWRKYGQKDILGAHNPRSYYRCRHRNAHGCRATKQVQRSDDDPSIFNVIYKGDHTCRGKPHLIPDQHQQLLLGPELLQSFQTALQVKTQGLDSEAQDPASLFSFPSTPASMNFSQDFIPTTTSESLLTQCQFEGQSELAEIIAAATQAGSSSTLDMDFRLDQLEIDTTFAFNTTNFKWWSDA